MSLELTITNAGRAAIVDAQSGGFSPVLITQVAFGSVAHQPTAAATQLMAEVKRISSISGSQTAEDIIHLTAVDNSNDEYSVREIGFYTNTGVLLGICSAPDTLIIEKSAVSSLFIAFDLTLQPDDAAVIEFGNTDFLLPAATTNTEGAMRFANAAERLALTADNVAMTPAGVKQAINGETAAAAVKLSSARTFQATGDATGSASSDLAAGVSISLTLSATGVTAGSYRQVTVDAKGRVTGGSNPTTLAGYGITDAVPSGRTITAGTGLSGGGSLGANRTLDVLYGTTPGTAAQGNDSRIVNALQASQRSAANGVAALDANAKVPLSQIPDSIIGQVEYMGAWNAATNTPTLPTTPAEKGHYYVVTTAGTRFGHTFAVGDWCISDGSKWDKVDNTDAVSSVNGRTGPVTGLVESSDSRLTNAREWSAETVSQAEAEGGTGTTRRAWTAQRIFQAIAKATALSATKLATARTINGVSFDGSQNITIPASAFWPVGVTYIQFPGRAAPASLFGGTWSQLFHTEGVFFRTEGGGASAFGGGVQLDQMQTITGSFHSAARFPAASGAFTVGSQGSNGRSGDSSAIYNFSSANSPNARTGNETRPRNRTIRVWVKTA